MIGFLVCIALFMSTAMPSCDELLQLKWFDASSASPKDSSEACISAMKSEFVSGDNSGPEGLVAARSVAAASTMGGFFLGWDADRKPIAIAFVDAKAATK